MRVDLEAIALRGPGLDGWVAGRECLNGMSDWRPTATGVPATSLLKPNERRRLTPTLKLALALAEEATTDLEPEARAMLPSVFASTLGDSDITDSICDALTREGRPISPTHFHNSVHNAPAGYWAMATGNRAASTSIAAGEWTAGAGFLEAVTQCLALEQPLVCVLYDVCPPEALRPLADIEHGFGMALRLAPPGRAGPNRVAMTLTATECAETRLPTPWEGLRRSSPASRHLALAYAVATRMQNVILPMDRHRNWELKLEHGD
jgi:hypothetical protein